MDLSGVSLHLTIVFDLAGVGSGFTFAEKSGEDDSKYIPLALSYRQLTGLHAAAVDARLQAEGAELFHSFDRYVML